MYWLSIVVFSLGVPMLCGLLDIPSRKGVALYIFGLAAGLIFHATAPSWL